MQELIDEAQRPACRKHIILVKEGVNFTILPQGNQPASHGLVQFLKNNP